MEGWQETTAIHNWRTEPDGLQSAPKANAADLHNDAAYGAFPTFDNTQSLVVTGGTGRFLDATGTVTLTDTVTLGPQARAAGTFQGLLNLPAVPEPATWAMMIGGFGMVGGAMRSARRKRKASVSYT